jgi:SAM-dependent methyltransferase
MVGDLRNTFRSKKDVFVREFDITKKPPKEFNLFFSTIYGINVLEHIEDDKGALKNIRKILNKNGKLILLVPAKRKAYTKLDRELGHFRRYEKEELSEKLERSGYKVDKIYYFNIVGLISWYIRDKVKTNNVNLKPYHIKIFDSIIPFLRMVESVIKIPMGISLIVVARKSKI